MPPVRGVPVSAFPRTISPSSALQFPPNQRRRKRLSPWSFLGPSGLVLPPVGNIVFLVLPFHPHYHPLHFTPPSSPPWHFQTKPQTWTVVFHTFITAFQSGDASVQYSLSAPCSETFSGFLLSQSDIQGSPQPALSSLPNYSLLSWLNSKLVH